MAVAAPERSRFDAAIGKARHLLITMAGRANDALMEIGDAGLVTWAHGNLLAVFGRGVPEDRVDIYALTFEDDQDFLEELLVRVAADHVVEHIKLRILNADHGIAWVDLSGLAVEAAEDRLHLCLRRSDPPDREVTTVDDLMSVIENHPSFFEGAVGSLRLSTIDLAEDDLKAAGGLDGHAEFQRQVRNSLRAWSVDGQSAAVLGDGRYAVVHEGELFGAEDGSAGKALQSKVDAIARRIVPEAIVLASHHTVALGGSGDRQGRGRSSGMVRSLLGAFGAKGKRMFGTFEQAVSEFSAGSAPFGYALDSYGDYTVDEAEARLVRQIFSMRHTGRSAQEIADRLTEIGVSWRFELPWTAPLVSEVLTDLHARRLVPKYLLS